MEISGFNKWKYKVKQEALKLMIKATTRVMLAGLYTVSYIKSLAGSVARAKKATKRGKDEKHHIVAQKAAKATIARNILKKKNISLNSKANTVVLDYRLHRRIHTNVYYDFVNYYIKRGPQLKSNIYRKLSTIKATLVSANLVVKRA